MSIATRRFLRRNPPGYKQDHRPE